MAPPHTPVFSARCEGSRDIALVASLGKDYEILTLSMTLLYHNIYIVPGAVEGKCVTLLRYF